MSPRLVPLILSVALFVSTRSALAETPPNAWDVARDPEARQQWALHVRVQRILFAKQGGDDAVADPRLDTELRHEAARAMLEEADAGHSPDVRLRFDLGYVYYSLAEGGGRVDLYQKAIDVLVPAVDMAPDTPALTDALGTLVYAYAKSNRPREELATWNRYIPRLVDDSARASAMMNLGEAEMRLGHVEDAQATFREVMRVCGGLPNVASVGSTYVLSLWDLAVALDRGGDPAGALAAASRASSMQVIGSWGRPVSGAALIKSDPSVFFVPEWEREWYLALLATAGARESKSARDAVPLWAAAEKSWESYVTRASADGSQETFVRVARVRLDHVRAEKRAAIVAAAHEKPLPKRNPAWEDGR